MIIDLPQNVEQQLIQTAQHQGVSVAKLIEKMLVAEKNPEPPKQWAFVKNLTPFDPTMEQAIEELQNLPPQERDGQGSV